MSSRDPRVVPEHHSHPPDSHRDVTGGRQLLLGAAATALLTYGVGSAVGAGL